METLVLERRDRLVFVGTAGLVRPQDVAEELSADNDWDIQKSNPYLKWVAGDFVEADKANSNTQFWTKNDLEIAEYTIKYAPLNMLHRQRTPVGFFAATKKVDLVREQADASGTMKIQTLAGMWSHLFPHEANLVDAASDANQLYFSMECRGSHLRCAGDEGCGQQFEYANADAHCEHLKNRTSVRHIVNPIFRGGALIIPPTQPGWKNAYANVISDAVKEEACRWAEQTEQSFLQANAAGSELSATAWEMLMAQILTFADKNPH